MLVGFVATEWEAITGIPRNVIYKRLDYGWTVERTLTEKVQMKIKLSPYERECIEAFID